MRRTRGSIGPNFSFVEQIATGRMICLLTVKVLFINGQIREYLLVPQRKEPYKPKGDSVAERVMFQQLGSLGPSLSQ
jgi:hypothetical protein